MRFQTNTTLKVIVSIEDEVQGGRNNVVSVPTNVIILDENDNAPDFIDVSPLTPALLVLIGEVVGSL
mgnify:CR=1 FL=1